jgi:hypothetical protein
VTKLQVDLLKSALGFCKQRRDQLARFESFRSHVSVTNDGRQIVETRLPFEHTADAVAGGDELGRVARAAAGTLDLEVDAGDALYALDHFQYGKPRP